MKLIDVQQGSQEWLDLRRTKITATDCAAILGKSKYKSQHMVWKDKMGKSKTFDNDAMRRGRALEPIARAYFNRKFGFNWYPAVGISDANPWQMASLDGWDAKEKVILEIKCPGENVFRDAQAGIFNEDYIWQCLHQMAVCGEAECNRLSFYFEGSNGPESTDLVIDRSEAEIIDLTANEGRWYRSYVLPFIEPPLGPLDYLAREDAEWEGLCEEWKTAKRLTESCEIEENRLRDRLIALAGDQNCKGAGVQLTKYTRQGNVEYAKVPQLQGVDLSPYRKPSIDAWKVTELKD